MMDQSSGFHRVHSTQIEPIRTRVLKSKPLDVLEVVGFISGVVGICVVIGLVAGWLG